MRERESVLMRIWGKLFTDIINTTNPPYQNKQLKKKMPGPEHTTTDKSFSYLKIIV